MLNIPLDESVGSRAEESEDELAMHRKFILPCQRKPASA
jgi:hypothetical protein